MPHPNPLAESYRIVYLNRDMECWVSPCDYDRVKALGVWTIQVNDNDKMYARTSLRRPDGSRFKIYMHRFITGCIDPKLAIDHQNNNGLDNRRCNLRVTTWKFNSMNCQSDSETGYRGVTKVNRRYRARIREDAEDVHLGYYDTAEEAAHAYDHEAVLRFGEFAWTNFKRSV